MTGPIIGSALYASLGYERMFYVYGGAEIVFALILRFGTPEIGVEETKEEQGPIYRTETSYRRSIERDSISSLSIQGIAHARVSIYSDQGVHLPVHRVIDEERRNRGKEDNRPSYSSLLKITRYTFALISPGLSQCHFCAMEPILSQRLINKNLTTM